jgi:hypothetical protein
MIKYLIFIGIILCSCKTHELKYKGLYYSEDGTMHDGVYIKFPLLSLNSVIRFYPNGVYQSLASSYRFDEKEHVFYNELDSFKYKKEAFSPSARGYFHILSDSIFLDMISESDKDEKGNKRFITKSKIGTISKNGKTLKLHFRYVTTKGDTIDKYTYYKYLRVK